MAGTADASSDGSGSGSGRRVLTRRNLIKAAAAIGVGSVPVLWARGNGPDSQTALPPPRPTTPSTASAAAVTSTTGGTAATIVPTTTGIGGVPAATTTTEFPPLPEGPVIRAVNFHPGSERSAIPMLGALNVQAVRINIGWHEFQPNAKHQWDDRFTPWLDAFLPAMARQGVRVLAGVVFSPGWANGGEAKESRNFRDEDFCDFVGDVEQRWGRFIEAYEIWNEPGYTFLEGSLEQKADRYAELLRAVYPYLKARVPAKPVLGGSLYQPVYDNQEFLAMLYERGAADSFDVLSQHMFGDRPGDARGYGFGEAPVPYADMFQAIADNTLETMRRYGDGNKPIWITETGVNTSTGGNGQGEDVQARQMAEAYEQLRLGGIPNIERLYWYHLTDDSRFDERQPENRFGIMSLEGGAWRLKPAFEVLANVS